MTPLEQLLYYASALAKYGLNSAAGDLELANLLLDISELRASGTMDDAALAVVKDHTRTVVHKMAREKDWQTLFGGFEPGKDGTDREREPWWWWGEELLSEEQRAEFEVWKNRP